jgi:hypothetical protein
MIEQRELTSVASFTITGSSFDAFFFASSASGGGTTKKITKKTTKKPINHKPTMIITIFNEYYSNANKSNCERVFSHLNHTTD